MNKIIYIGISVFAMGIFVLPQTFSLFSGGHDWYNTTDIRCEKCHNDVSLQMTGSNSPHSEMTCKNCHQINMIQSGAHAATLPLCINCHNGNMTPSGTINSHALGIQTNCVKCHDGAQMATGLNVQSELNNVNESHRGYIVDAENSTLMRGSNEACIGCHTHVQVNITWKKPTTMEIIVVRSTNGNNIVNFSEVTT